MMRVHYRAGEYNTIADNITTISKEKDALVLKRHERIVTYVHIDNLILIEEIVVDNAS